MRCLIGEIAAVSRLNSKESVSSTIGEELKLSKRLYWLPQTVIGLDAVAA